MPGRAWAYANQLTPEEYRRGLTWAEAIKEREKLFGITKKDGCGSVNYEK